MPSNKPLVRLLDVVDDIDRIRRFVECMSEQASVGDDKTAYAVERAFLNIAEASRKLPLEILENQPAIPRQRIMGFGSRIRHDYGEIDRTIVWDTIANDLDPLEAAILDEINKVQQ